MTTPNEAKWKRELPTVPGLYMHRNLENVAGAWKVPLPIPERVMFVGYVNFEQDPNKGHGTTPMRYGSFKLRSVRAEHPLTTDSLTVAEWGGEWCAIASALDASAAAAVGMK